MARQLRQTHPLNLAAVFAVLLLASTWAWSATIGIVAPQSSSPELRKLVAAFTAGVDQVGSTRPAGRDCSLPTITISPEMLACASAKVELGLRAPVTDPRAIPFLASPMPLLDSMKELQPGLRRVHVLVNVRNTLILDHIRWADRERPNLLQVRTVDGPGAAMTAYRELLEQIDPRTEGIWVVDLSIHPEVVLGALMGMAWQKQILIGGSYLFLAQWGASLATFPSLADTRDFGARVGRWVLNGGDKPLGTAAADVGISHRMVRRLGLRVPAGRFVPIAESAGL